MTAPIEFRGVGGYEMAAEGLPSLFRIDDLSIVGLAAIPRPASDDHQADPPDRARRDRGAARRHGDHRQPGFHPPGRAARAACKSHPFRSSIMCRPRSGPGGRDARAPCGAISIMCWRCFRSSRRRTESSAGRLAPMSGIRWSSRSTNCGRTRRKNAAANASPPILLVLPGSRRERDQASCGAVPAGGRTDREDRSGRWTSSFRQPRISPMPSSARPRIGRCVRRSWSSARIGARRSGRRARRSQNPARSRSSLPFRACRW